MRRNQYQDAVLRQTGAIHTHAFVAEHRLTGLRHHLQDVLAEPPLTSGLFALPGLLVLVSATIVMILLA